LSELIFHQAGEVEGSVDVVTVPEAPRAANEVEVEELSKSTGRRTVGPSTNTVNPPDFAA